MLKQSELTMRNWLSEDDICSFFFSLRHFVDSCQQIIKTLSDYDNNVDIINYHINFLLILP